MEFDFKLNTDNNHWPILYSDGFIYVHIDWGTTLAWYQPGASWGERTSKSLATNRWYKLKINAKPSQNKFDIYLDNKYLGSVTNIKPLHDYRITAALPDKSLIWFGDIDSKNDRGGSYNRGNVCWKSIVFNGTLNNTQTINNENVWALNAANNIFKWNGKNWDVYAGKAQDIGVGANGSVWIMDTERHRYGGSIYRLEGSQFVKTSGQGVRIDVDPYGNPWVINNRSNIYKWVNNAWHRMPGSARDIGIGANGDVWIIGSMSVSNGNYGIYKWSGSQWVKFPGAAVRIDVGPRGAPWVVNSIGDIYKWEGNHWVNMPGKAKDISIGADGEAWIVGTNPVAGGYGIYRWNKKLHNWVRIPGGATAISVGGMPIGGRIRIGGQTGTTTTTDTGYTHEPNGSAPDISGTWKWFDGETIHIYPNGTATDGFKGKWQASWNGSGFTYTINWNNGQYIDTLTLHGNTLDGHNQNGTHVWGKRILPGRQISRGMDRNITWDFETGRTNGWTKTGTAFNHQPTYGDNPTARHRGQPSNHVGNYWIGTYEKYQGYASETPGSIQGDGPKGTLTSNVFTIPSGTLTFLIGGGSSFQTRVELLVSGKRVLYASGRNTETMHRVTWDLNPWVGRQGQIRIVDNASGGWGHINADDFRFSHSSPGSVGQPGEPGGGLGGDTPFGTANFDEFSLKGNIYFLKPNTSRLPDFGKMTPVGTIYTKALNVSLRSFTEGFPGVTNRFEWFGIRYTGAFKILSGGQYKFRLVSDDGAKLWIDNQLIINNDGLQPFTSKAGSVYLNPGLHEIRVDYFQGPRTMLGLQLFVTPPGGTEKIFSPKYASNRKFVQSGSAQTATLRSGTYRVEQGHWKSTWRLHVSNGRISGTSEWSCCPGHRIDQLRGTISGNSVVIERDCSGQGWSGPCRQTYRGRIKGDRITGPCSGTGLTPGDTWVLYLDNKQTMGEIIGVDGKCLDVRGGSSADGTPLILYHCTGGKNQQWKIKYH